MKVNPQGTAGVAEVGSNSDRGWVYMVETPEDGPIAIDGLQDVVLR
jgi:hypothetical protein